MDSNSLVNLATNALDDRKATDVRVLDVRLLTDITDYMVIATGQSTRQTTAIAEHLIDQAKKSGQPPVGVEGLSEGEWVLVDLVDIVVHVMTPPIRDLYQLEALWTITDGVFNTPVATSDTKH